MLKKHFNLTGLLQMARRTFRRNGQYTSRTTIYSADDKERPFKYRLNS